MQFNLNKNYKLLLFIGSPRTGSTLLGQLLNYHPECLIANESRFLTHVIEGDQPLNQAKAEMLQNASIQFQQGLEVTLGEEAIHRYQPRWKDVAHLTQDSDFQKRLIKVIGDKKAGGAIQTYINAPKKVESFLQLHPNVHLIQIVRNPIDAAHSYMKSHRVSFFDVACEEIVIKTQQAYMLIQKKLCFGYVIYYEDLLLNPVDQLRHVLYWLNLDIKPNWLTQISSIVNNENPVLDRDYHQYFIARKLISKYQADEVFRRYLNYRK